jgi:transketolase
MTQKITSIEAAKFIRLKSMYLTSLNNSSHIGPIFSIADIVACLYFGFMRLNPKNSEWDKRDRFILSKGHAGLAIYVALNLVGYISESLLYSYYQDASYISGHISMNKSLGVEFSTGSLGHGLPVAVGLAIALKKKNSNSYVTVLIGDGECNEGTTWESALIAAHLGLNNLIVIVDNNDMQSLGRTSDVLSLKPFAKKWLSFNWEVIEVDGHNHKALLESLDKIRKNSRYIQKPFVVIAKTIKGKGVSFMENNLAFHYRPLKFGEEFDLAFREVNGNAE